MDREQLRYCARALPTWAGHYISNTWGILNVFDMAWLRPVPGGLIPADHPFASGLRPESGEPIWSDNLLFATPRNCDGAESDAAIIDRVMSYIAGIVRQSASSAEHPIGRTAAMPPAINLLHGPVHYNGVSLLFNDTREAMRHMTDRRFVRELRRFIDTERRELVLIFRDRDYDPEDLALFTCFARSVLPYWANPNGNKRRMHWGVPGPYPLVNIITGHWIRDTRMLLDETERQRVARPPIRQGAYFQEGTYDEGWDTYLWPERFLARFTSWRIRIRKEQGGLYFVDAKSRKAGMRFDPKALPTLGERLEAKRRRARDGLRARLSRRSRAPATSPARPLREPAPR